MGGAFETNVEILCFSSPVEALRNAMQVATISGGVVVEIGRITIEAQHVLFHGTIPRQMACDIFRRAYSELTSTIVTNPSCSCTLHTTWAGILSQTKSIGYLPVNNFGPTVKVVDVKDWDDETGSPDVLLCILAFERVLFSLPQTSYGVTYCDICGCQIPERRVVAVPGVCRCIRCQDM